MNSALLKVKVALEYSKDWPRANLFAPSVIISVVFVGVGLTVSELDKVGLGVFSVDGVPPQPEISKTRQAKTERKVKNLTIFYLLFF
jgi:hypothetical protein